MNSLKLENFILTLNAAQVKAALKEAVESTYPGFEVTWVQFVNSGSSLYKTEFTLCRKREG